MSTRCTGKVMRAIMMSILGPSCILYFPSCRVCQQMAILSRKQNITISVYKAKEAAMSILVFGEQSVQWSFSESTVAESHVKIFTASVLIFTRCNFWVASLLHKGLFYMTIIQWKLSTYCYLMNEHIKWILIIEILLFYYRHWFERQDCYITLCIFISS